MQVDNPISLAAPSTSDFSNPRGIRTAAGTFILHRRAPMVPHVIFPIDLTAALIVFPKYTDLVCIFNQCSNRARLPLVRAILLSVRFATRFFPAGRIRRAGTFPAKLDIRNFVRTIAGIERGRVASSSSFLPPIDLPAAFSRLANIVRALPLNSISFVSFHAFCYARSTCV